MLDLLNLFCHGYVATPLIEACRRRGLFGALDAHVFRGRAGLAGELGANTGYLAVALHALESLGWIERSAGGDAVRLTAAAKSEAFDLDLTALYAIEPQRLIDDPGWTAQLVRKLDGILRDGRGADELSVKLMLGAVVLPLVTALQQSPASLAEVLRHEAIGRLFVQQEWLAADGTLTATGRHLLQTHVFTISLSYRPMLHAWEDLLFGDHERVYRRNEAGEETHVDRRLNVIASGLQHESYFKDIRRKVIDLFDREPLEEQPRAVIDVGCGDGSLLRQVYQAIREESLRGRHLERLPVRLIGVDYNREALEETARTLAGLDHQVLHGDINRPDELERALAAQCGLTPEQRVLHIRSFLDHNIHVDAGQPIDEALRVLAADQPDCYVDAQGRWLDPLQVLSRWQEHLRAWAQCTHDSDLLILEAHALPARQIPAQLASSENFYFDTIHYLSHQYLISAEAFVTLAAAAGLFAEGSVQRYPKLASFCRISMHHLRRRDYVVRHAAEGDLEALDRLERLCWPKGSQIPRRLLRARLERYPQGQFVLERDGEVMAAIYSQRIASLEALDGRDLRSVHELHHPSGPIVQFLALNVDPRVQNLRYGDQLLEFMLQRCSLMTGVTRIAGVTVCRNYDAGGPRSFEEYIRREGDDQDPVLAFHRAHGATIAKALPGYRPRDLANEGYGVLVTYDVHERVAGRAERRG
ncbi:MAG TPA: class I SAM-dependent methyltransferase, partial [Thermoanaerobaculia bacterium]|nr:class I SAM-dependent methyltransferase [Thermoanaerobaculia bacterium]